MVEHHSPIAGWYDDPHRALHLRWWDGAMWTAHTRPKPVSSAAEPATEAGVATGVGSAASTTDVTGTTGATSVIAEPTLATPYAYSAPYSWSPSAPAAPPSEPTVVEHIPERSTTPASWALALTPLVVVLAELAAVALTGFESTPLLWIVGAAVIPILWLVVWVRRDRVTLHEWGHLRRPAWGWAFLGDVGYLTARTVILHRVARRSWWPLVLNLGLITLLINVGLFTPIFGVFGTIVL